MILRDRLLLLQARAGETIKAATKCAAASARSSTRLRARASIPLPAQALLASPPEFECEKTTPTHAQTDPDAALGAKLDYERQCYRQAEMILRDRLLGLQASVGETIKAVNRGAPPAVRQPMVKQQRRPPPVGQATPNWFGRGVGTHWQSKNRAAIPHSPKDRGAILHSLCVCMVLPGLNA
jgi:hypothetical protein